MAAVDIESIYDELQEFSDSLWDISQSVSTDPPSASKAQSMHDTLESVYLEPIRRKIYQSDSIALGNAYLQLQKTTEDLDQTIKDISDVINQTKQFDQYAKLFDGVIAVAAKMLLLFP